MSLRTKTIPGASFVLGALLVVACVERDRAPAAQPVCGAERDDLMELKKRVTKLEAEVAEMRKALRQAGGVPDNATEIKNVREVAKVRSADLLQRARNVHDVLRQVTNGKLADRELLTRINDLNNDLTALWLSMAGSGLGRDPYLDNIQLSGSGFSRAKTPPDHGIPGPYAGIGMPRLYERFLEVSEIKGKEAEKKRAEFEKLLRAYSNPAVYTHRNFGERAYEEYRAGKGLGTPQYAADLKTVDQWLTDLEIALGQVPGYFEKAP